MSRGLLTTLKSLAGVRLGQLRQHEAQGIDWSRLPPAPPVAAPAPVISIVTPSFNQAAFLPGTIESVLSQDYPALEYAICDGGSTDGSREIIAAQADKLTYWVSQRDNGQSSALNDGFARTRGAVMAYLNSDDLLLPGALAAVADVFNRNPDVDVIYGDRVLIDQENRALGRWVMPRHNRNAYLFADFVPQETLFWRRSIWEKVGGQIDESYHFAMDWDLIARFDKAGAKFLHLPRFLGAFRIHTSQKTSTEFGNIGRAESIRVLTALHGHMPGRLTQHLRLLPYALRQLAADRAARRRYEALLTGG